MLSTSLANWIPLSMELFLLMVDSPSSCKREMLGLLANLLKLMLPLSCMLLSLNLLAAALPLPQLLRMEEGALENWNFNVLGKTGLHDMLELSATRAESDSLLSSFSKVMSSLLESKMVSRLFMVYASPPWQSGWIFPRDKLGSSRSETLASRPGVKDRQLEMLSLSSSTLLSSCLKISKIVLSDSFRSSWENKGKEKELRKHSQHYTKILILKYIHTQVPTEWQWINFHMGGTRAMFGTRQSLIMNTWVLVWSQV